MALNEVFKLGTNISMPVPDGTASGDPVRVGVLNGVAVTDEGRGGNASGYASVDLTGGHKHIIPGAGVGDAVYIANDGTLSTDSDDGDLYGAVTHLDPRVEDRVVVLTQTISV